MNHNKILVAGLILTLGIVITAGCIEGEKRTDENENIKFSSGTCETGFSVALNKSELGLLEKKWIDNQTLFIRYGVEITGCFKAAKGSAEIKNKTINLKYSPPEYKKGDQAPSIICGIYLNYTLYNLPKKDYKITIEKN